MKKCEPQSEMPIFFFKDSLRRDSRSGVGGILSPSHMTPQESRRGNVTWSLAYRTERDGEGKLVRPTCWVKKQAPSHLTKTVWN